MIYLSEIYIHFAKSSVDYYSAIIFFSKLTTLTYLVYFVTILFGCLSSKQMTFLMNGVFDVASIIFPVVNEVVKTILGFDKVKA